jgi:hypothetical protein
MSSLQDEDIPARKKPRLEEPLPSPTANQAAGKTALPDISVSLSNDDDNEDADAATDTQANIYGVVATRSWTSEEDAKLTRAAANTPKKRRGNKYKTGWVAISELVPGRTRSQCCQRWSNV